MKPDFSGIHFFLFMIWVQLIVLTLVIAQGNGSL